MSSTSLPPLPALIPIAVLKKSPLNNNNNGGGEDRHRDHHPKVIGEQRPARPPAEPADVPIDTARSRGTSAAPRSRIIRPERHRKSDRRRDRRRRVKTRSDSKRPDQCQEGPINPRVNPIFVWVRQEDTRIVEVKCEDYDKRNRILLTKTPQGWRATPRTESAVPHPKEEDDKRHQHHHHHRSKKSKKNKMRQKSTAVQVGDFSDENQEEPNESRETYPDWESPVNVESLLPSHTIHVHRKDSEQSSCVNSGVIDDSAQIQNKCSADKICDISPLDNLLAVAELEFNQQIQSGGWNDSLNIQQTDNEVADTAPSLLPGQDLNEEQKVFLDDIDHLENLFQSCTQDDKDKLTPDGNFLDVPSSKEDCDYTEDEENNLAMNDILNRLEQSLRSPESSEIECEKKTPETDKHPEVTQEFNEKEAVHSDDFHVTDSFVDETLKDLASDETDIIEEHLQDSIASEESKEEQPTDLSLKSKKDLTIEIPPPRNDYFEQPTDLSIPKHNKYSPGTVLTPRPPSQNSEALQSPQPSGLPAVPPSPDIVSPGSVSNMTTITKGKPTFLETLLASSSPKMALNPEVTIERQEKPLDLGTCRKSPSPRVTCSEEVQKPLVEGEPPSKKLKTLEPISFENLLDNVSQFKSIQEVAQKTTKLTDVLESDLSPVVQLQRLLSDKKLNIPDPMLVPKKYLRKIISNPGKEIPELLRCRPELRLPEALEFSHLLQDPDILVITIQQLEKIIKQQTQSIEKFSKSASKAEKIDKEKEAVKNIDKESARRSGGNKAGETGKLGNSSKNPERPCENDVEAASNAALNQILWLPYMNQYDGLQFGGNPDLMLMLANSNMNRTMPAHPSDLSHLMSNNGFPGNFRMPPYNNPIEMQMWQGAIIQAGLLGQKDNTYESRNSFKDLMERINYEDLNRKYMQNQKYSMENKYGLHNNQFFPVPTAMAGMSNPYMGPQASQVNMKSSMPTASQFNLQKNMAEHMNWQKHNSKTGHHPHHRSTQDKSFHHGTLRMKPAYKLMNTTTHDHVVHTKEKYTDGQPRHPIDLSGASPTIGVKSKVKQHQSLIDSFNGKHTRNEDVGEVGSTTASIEEMQEAHKHLWHPLFGNEKCHSNPWNWTSSVSTSSE